MDWTTYLTPTLGVGGLLGAFVIALLRGNLVPKSIVDGQLADRDKQIETWRSNYERSLEIQDEQRRQLTVLLEANETTARVIAAIPRAAARNGKHEGRTRELAADTDA